MTPIRNYCDCRGYEAGTLVRVKATGVTYRALRLTAKGESPTTAADAWQMVNIGDGRGTLARGMEARPR